MDEPSSSVLEASHSASFSVAGEMVGAADHQEESEERRVLQRPQMAQNVVPGESSLPSDDLLMRGQTIPRLCLRSMVVDIDWLSNCIEFLTGID